MSDRPVGAGGAGGTVGAMAPTDQLTLSQRGVQIIPTALQLSPSPRIVRLPSTQSGMYVRPL